MGSNCVGTLSLSLPTECWVAGKRLVIALASGSVPAAEVACADFSGRDADIPAQAVMP